MTRRSTTAPSRLRSLFLSILTAIALSACTDGGNAEKRGAAAARDAAARTAVESAAERGPVRLLVTANADRITVGEKLTLTVEVIAETGVDVVMPSIDETLGAFSVRSAKTPPDVPVEASRRWLYTYALDTFTPGPAEIPAIAVEFSDRRPAALSASGDAIEGSIESEPLTVNVASVLAGDETDADFRDIRDRVSIPIPAETRRRNLLLVAVVILLILGAASFFLLLRRRAAAAVAAPVIPPYEWAMGELEALAREGLIERRAFHAFYFRLSDIVRHYIERRFGLMAPERTTEEFLRELRRDPGLGPEHRDLLSGFLRAADMVKFALHEPSPDESHDAFDAARGFVEQTRPEPLAPAEAAA